MYLSNNRLSGTLGEEIIHLSSLGKLSVNWNNLSGTIGQICPSTTANYPQAFHLVSTLHLGLIVLVGVLSYELP